MGDPDQQVNGSALKRGRGASYIAGLMVAVAEVVRLKSSLVEPGFAGCRVRNWHLVMTN